MALVDISTLRALIEKYATANGIDPKLLEIMIMKESGNKNANSGKVNTTAVSPAQAVGVAQLMPGTAKRFGVTDRTDPEQSIRGAAEYLKFLTKKFNGDLPKILAGYNAGEGAVDKYKGVPPYPETRDYVNVISKKYAQATTGQASTSTGAASPFTQNQTGFRPWNPDTIPAVANTQRLVASQPLAAPSQPLTAAPYQSTVSAVQTPATAQTTGTEMVNGVLSNMPTQPVTAASNTASHPAVLKAQQLADGVNGNDTTAAIQALRKTAEMQQQGADGINKLMAGVIGLPDYAGAQQKQVSALQQLYDTSANSVNSTLEAMKQQDLQKRQLVQGIQDAQNYDPLNPTSQWNSNLSTLAMIDRRMNATVLAEQRLQDASIMDRPADFLERVLFGNRYKTGAAELDTQRQRLDNTMTSVQNQLNSQAKVAAATQLSDPALLQAQLNADLQLAGIKKDVGIAQAEAPIKAFDAQARGISSLADLYAAQANAQAGVANTQIKAAEVQQTNMQNQIQAATLPLQVEGQVVGLETAKENLGQQRFQTSQQPVQAAANQVNLQQAALQLAQNLRTAPAETASQILQAEAKTVEAQAMLPTLRAKLAVVQQMESNGQLATAAGVSALADYNNAIVSFQEASTKASTGAAAKQVMAANATNDSVLKMQPITDKVNTKQAEVQMAEYARAEKDQAQIQSGWNNLGLPPDQMPSLEILKGAKYSKGVIPALIAANTGGRVAANTPKAVAVLSELGATNANTKYPALSFTAGRAYETAKTVAAAQGPLDENSLETLDQSLINKEFIRQQSTASNIANTSNPTDVYGILPPSYVAPFASSQGSQAIAQHFVSKETAKQKIGSYAEMLTEAKAALDAAGIPKGVAQDKAVAEYFQAVVAANNKLRGYDLIGVPQQDGIKVKIDTLEFGLGSGDPEYDLTTVVGITALSNIGTAQRIGSAIAAPTNRATGLPAFRTDSFVAPPSSIPQQGLPAAAPPYGWQ